MPEPLLTVAHIDVYYGPVQALFDVSLTVNPGETVVVLGGNASGKSTTVKSVLGLVRPRNGEIHFDGRRIDGQPPQAIVQLGFGSIPEGRRVFVEMSVEENVRLGAYTRRHCPPEELERDLHAAWEMFPRLAERRRQIAGTLSGGEQQMLAMARAYMRRPRVLCIDEPSMGLSPLFVERVYDILESWKREGLTLLIVEQNATMALALADRAYVLRGGEVVIAGDARELERDDRVRHAYLGG